MSKLLPLNGKHGAGKFSIVDDDCYDWLIQGQWHVTTDGYVGRTRRLDEGPLAGQMIFVHRLVAGTPKGMVTDHINGDKLDNRRCNLRICTQAENVRNIPRRKDNKSGHVGVSLQRSGRWKAYIRVNRKRISLGIYDTPEDAALAYNQAALKYFGEFARLNMV